MSLPEGYEIPLARALTERVMMAGVPRTLAVVEGGCMLSLIFAVGPSRALLWVMPLLAAVHWGLVSMYYRDPYAGENWIAYAKQPSKLKV